MGKGDKKTKRGKIIAGSHGKARMKKDSNPLYKAPPEPKEKVEKVPKEAVKKEVKPKAKVAKTVKPKADK